MTPTERDELRQLQDRYIALLRRRQQITDETVICDHWKHGRVTVADLRTTLYPEFASFMREAFTS